MAHDRFVVELLAATCGFIGSRKFHKSIIARLSSVVIVGNVHAHDATTKREGAFQFLGVVRKTLGEIRDANLTLWYRNSIACSVLSSGWGTFSFSLKCRVGRRLLCLLSLHHLWLHAVRRRCSSCCCCSHLRHWDTVLGIVCSIGHWLLHAILLHSVCSIGLLLGLLCWRSGTLLLALSLRLCAIAILIGIIRCLLLSISTICLLSIGSVLSIGPILVVVA
mmetsp:Transcript_6000/g.22732  ORF Transcript_6000/g.22732 Transcript_6000/m.22732 type:complete len:221 (+) Transcript_6000:1825-2487(+)